jgi:modulator of FtsH protease
MNDHATWADFFVASMGAAAALSGLVIVAISINLKHILKFKHLPGRAGEALLILMGAMLVSGVGLIPQPAGLQGVEMAAIGIFVTAASVHSQLAAFRMLKNPPLKWWITRALTTPITALPIAVGGVLQMAGIEGGLYWVAGGVLASLVAGVQATWILLIEILR